MPTEHLEFDKRSFDVMEPKQLTDEFESSGRSGYWMSVTSDAAFGHELKYRRLRSLCTPAQIAAVEALEKAEAPKTFPGPFGIERSTPFDASKAGREAGENFAKVFRKEGDEKCVTTTGQLATATNVSTAMNPRASNAAEETKAAQILSPSFMDAVERWKSEIVGYMNTDSLAIQLYDAFKCGYHSRDARIAQLEKELKSEKRYAMAKDDTATTFMNQVKKLQTEIAAYRMDLPDDAKEIIALWRDWSVSINLGPSTTAGWYDLSQGGFRAGYRYAKSIVKDLRKQIDTSEIAHGVTIHQRDAAENALGEIYFAAIGQSPEWSNFFGYKEAVDEIETKISSLESKNRELEAACEEKHSTLYSLWVDCRGVVSGSQTHEEYAEFLKADLAIRVEKALSKTHRSELLQRVERMEDERAGYILALNKIADPATSNLDSFKIALEALVPQTEAGNKT